MKDTINKDTKIPLSLIITFAVIISGVIAFAYNERSERMILSTRFESHILDPNIHHQGFENVKKQVEHNRQMLIEIREIKTEIKNIKETINNK